MTEEAENKEPDSGRNIQVHVPTELEYHYRDIVNVFVGAGDAVLEMGDFHRSITNTATISNRVVLSVAAAYELHNTLGQALANAQQQLQQNLKK
jgi:hypothetical protein